MSRHAYLIMAHDRFDQLRLLLSAIDDERNDIFLHIDKKASFEPGSLETAVTRSTLHFVPRIQVSWGPENMVMAELILLRSATEAGSYEYYHLLTGQDLPLRSQGRIHDYFDAHRGEEFVSFVPSATRADRERVSLWHPVVGRRGRRQSFSENAKSLVNSALCAVQRACRVDRVPDGLEIKKGSVYFSITDSLARYVVSQDAAITSLCRQSFCADEIFLQTLVWNSPWRDVLHPIGRDDTPLSRSMRLIDWDRGGPYTWRSSDIPELRASEMLFARKFDMNVDAEVVREVASWSRVTREDE